MLKAGGEAAEKMYGEKGKNGVIIVTTKAGKKDKSYNSLKEHIPILNFMVCV